MPGANRRSIVTIMGGAIERIDPDPALRAELATTVGMKRVRTLAAAGIWYDTFDAISTLIDDDPRSAELRGRRAELLDAMGLSKVAAYERASIR